MKKLFVLLFSTGMILTASAQSSRNQSRDVILGQSDRTVYNDNYDRNGFTNRERDDQIRRINREFDARLYSIQRDRYMRNAEKRRAVRELEMQRNQAIRDVNYRYENTRNRGYSNNNNNRDRGWNGRY
jgi:hypothetical protein